MVQISYFEMERGINWSSHIYEKTNLTLSGIGRMILVSKIKGRIVIVGLMELGKDSKVLGIPRNYHQV